MKLSAMLLGAALSIQCACADDLSPEYSSAGIPDDCRVTRKSYIANGVEFIAHLILPKESNWQLALLTEKRNLPSGRQKLTSFKAVYNTTAMNLKKQGFNNIDADLPDLSKLDPANGILIPMRMNLAGRPYVGEVSVKFTNMAHAYVLIANDAESLEQARRVSAGIIPVRDNELFESALREVRDARPHTSEKGRFSINIPPSFSITDESTEEKEAHIWLKAVSPQLTIRVATRTKAESAHEAYRTAKDAQKKHTSFAVLGIHEIHGRKDFAFRIDDVFNGDFTSVYCLDSGNRAFMVLVEYQDLLAYCARVPLSDAIVNSLRASP